MSTFKLLSMAMPLVFVVSAVEGGLVGHSYIDGTEYFVNVDPVSGLVPPVGPGLPGVHSVNAFLSALDPINRQYFFESGELGLVTVDLDTGNLVRSAELCTRPKINMHVSV